MGLGQALQYTVQPRLGHIERARKVLYGNENRHQAFSRVFVFPANQQAARPCPA